MNCCGDIVELRSQQMTEPCTNCLFLCYLFLVFDYVQFAFLRKNYNEKALKSDSLKTSIYKERYLILLETE